MIRRVSVKPFAARLLDFNLIARSPELLATARTRLRRKRRRHGLAAGYRLMAWRAHRRGDPIGATTYAECSQVLRAKRDRN